MNSRPMVSRSFIKAVYPCWIPDKNEIFINNKEVEIVTRSVEKKLSPWKTLWKTEIPCAAAYLSNSTAALVCIKAIPLWKSFVPLFAVLYYPMCQFVCQKYHL